MALNNINSQTDCGAVFLWPRFIPEILPSGQNIRIGTIRVLALFLLMALSVGMSRPVFAAEGEHHDALQEITRVLEKQDFSTGLAMLNKLVDEHPNSIEIREYRAFIYSSAGRGETALEDFEHLLVLKPDDKKIMLKRCMLFEAMEQNMEVLKPCYEDVVKKMRQKYPAALLARDQDYVLAVILAELPEAEAVKRNYIEQIPSQYNWEHTPFDKNDIKQLIKQEQDVIRNFDRRNIKKDYDFLREMFRQILPMQ